MFTQASGLFDALNDLSFVFELGGGAFGAEDVFTRPKINRLVDGA
jgi:hypothetical protein